jgi:hypothetical protein
MEPFGEVAALTGLPFVVHVGEHRADEADHGRVVGEDADHAGSAFDLLVDPLERVGNGYEGVDAPPVSLAARLWQGVRWSDYGATVRDRGVGSERGGQAGLVRWAESPC